MKKKWLLLLLEHATSEQSSASQDLPYIEELTSRARLEVPHEKAASSGTLKPDQLGFDIGTPPTTPSEKEKNS